MTRWSSSALGRSPATPASSLTPSHPATPSTLSMTLWWSAAGLVGAWRPPPSPSLPLDWCPPDPLRARRRRRRVGKINCPSSPCLPRSHLHLSFFCIESEYDVVYFWVDPMTPDLGLLYCSVVEVELCLVTMDWNTIHSRGIQRVPVCTCSCSCCCFSSEILLHVLLCVIVGTYIWATFLNKCC